MYRSSLLAAGDPAYRQALQGAGDPIFGLALRALPFVSKIATKLGPVRAIAGKLLGTKAGKLLKIAGGTVGAGAGFEAGAGLFRKATGAKAARVAGAGGRVRRMRVTNPKALRRALRRVAGFGKTVKRAKRAVSRAASAMGVRRGRGGRTGHPAGCRCVHCARK